MNGLYELTKNFTAQFYNFMTRTQDEDDLQKFIDDLGKEGH